MSIDRLRSHWGFTRMPFGRDLAPSMLHNHRSDAEAVARIAWCVEERALGVITGEVGAGRTEAVRAAVAALDTSGFSTLYFGNPSVGARGLYYAIVSGLGGVPGSTRRPSSPRPPTPWPSERGKRVVLVVDEAHLLDADQLEELRLLTGSEMDSRSFACLLVGQPTLRRRIKLGAFAPSTSASACATPCRAWTCPRPPPTWPITSSWPAGPTTCSPTTPSPSSTR